MQNPTSRQLERYEVAFREAMAVAVTAGEKAMVVITLVRMCRVEDLDPAKTLPKEAEHAAICYVTGTLK